MTRSSGESTDEEVLGAEEQLSRESRNWYKVNEQTQQHCWLLQETVANVVQDRLCWQKTSIRRHPPRLFQHCQQGIQWTASASGPFNAFTLFIWLTTRTSGWWKSAPAMHNLCRLGPIKSDSRKWTPVTPKFILIEEVVVVIIAFLILRHFAHVRLATAVLPSITRHTTQVTTTGFRIRRRFQSYVTIAG